MTNERCESERD